MHLNVTDAEFMHLQTSTIITVEVEPNLFHLYIIIYLLYHGYSLYIFVRYKCIKSASWS